MAGQNGAVAIDDRDGAGRHLDLANQGVEVIEDHGGGNHPLHYPVVDNRVTAMDGGLARGPAETVFPNGEVPGFKELLKMAAASVT